MCSKMAHALRRAGGHGHDVAELVRPPSACEARVAEHFIIDALTQVTAGSPAIHSISPSGRRQGSTVNCRIHLLIKSRVDGRQRPSPTVPGHLNFTWR